MKLFILFLILCPIGIFAQNTCNSTYSLFRFPTKNVKPIEIDKLGTSPQFNFLRHAKSKDDFFSGIENNKNSLKYKKAFNEFNRILTKIGFADGLDDKNFNEKSIEFLTIPKGTIGNTGSKAQKYIYVILLNDETGWKVTSPSGCYLYIFTTCGNAFFPQSPLQGKNCPDTCNKVSIVVPSDTTFIKFNCDTITVTTKIYIHYFKKMEKKIKDNAQQQQQQSKVFEKDSVFSDRLYWKTTIEQIVVPIAKENLVITPKLVLENRVCKDTIITLPSLARLTQKSNALSNCKYETNIQREIVLDVLKKQYKKIQKKIPQQQ